MHIKHHHSMLLWKCAVPLIKYRQYSSMQIKTLNLTSDGGWCWKGTMPLHTHLNAIRVKTPHEK